MNMKTWNYHRIGHILLIVLLANAFVMQTSARTLVEEIPLKSHWSHDATRCPILLPSASIDNNTIQVTDLLTSINMTIKIYASDGSLVSTTSSNHQNTVAISLEGYPTDTYTIVIQGAADSWLTGTFDI
jgi:hypothetical protein